MENEEKIAVIAGNPKVGLLANGEIAIKPQLQAFEQAMKFVGEKRGQIVKIYVAFDHLGNFKEHGSSSGI